MNKTTAQGDLPDNRETCNQCLAGNAKSNRSLSAIASAIQHILGDSPVLGIAEHEKGDHKRGGLFNSENTGI